MRATLRTLDGAGGPCLSLLNVGLDQRVRRGRVSDRLIDEAQLLNVMLAVGDFLGARQVFDGMPSSSNRVIFLEVEIEFACSWMSIWCWIYTVNGLVLSCKIHSFVIDSYIGCCEITMKDFAYAFDHVRLLHLHCWLIFFLNNKKLFAVWDI